MKHLLTLALLAVLLAQPASAYVFFFSDEIDRRNNINLALARPFDGIDLDEVADFDNYNCVSLADQHDFAARNRFDNEEPVTAKNIKRDDFQKLRYQDQLRIINEDPFDKWDEDLLERRNNQQCWTLKDYNKLARQKPRDEFDTVRFRDFDDLETVQKIGTGRFHFFEPNDFAEFDLHRTRAKRPFYEPYDFRRSPYPRYGYGIRYGNDRYYS